MFKCDNVLQQHCITKGLIHFIGNPHRNSYQNLNEKSGDLSDNEMRSKVTDFMDAKVKFVLIKLSFGI